MQNTIEIGRQLTQSLRSILLVVVCLLAATNAVSANLLPKEDAQQAPKTDLLLPLVQDNQISTSNTQLADYLGKVILIDFWASWCGPCRYSFPWMNDLQKKYSNDDFVIVAVNVDTDPKFAHQFLGKVPATFDVLLDSDAILQDAFEVLGMPTSFLIDKQGRIRATHIGFNKDKIALYEKDIVALLNEKR